MRHFRDKVQIKVQYIISQIIYSILQARYVLQTHRDARQLFTAVLRYYMLRAQRKRRENRSTQPKSARWHSLSPTRSMPFLPSMALQNFVAVTSSSAQLLGSHAQYGWASRPPGCCLPQVRLHLRTGQRNQAGVLSPFVGDEYVNIKQKTRTKKACSTYFV